MAADWSHLLAQLNVNVPAFLAGLPPELQQRLVEHLGETDHVEVREDGHRQCGRVPPGRHRVAA